MIRHLLLAAAALTLAAALPVAARPSARAGKALAEDDCAACHGATGNETEDGQTPRLAGQKPGYLIRQMTAFRADVLPSETMHDLAADLSDRQIADLAAWFASQPRSRPERMKKPLGNAATGARLFTARGRGTPPCAACHAPEDFRPGAGRGGMGYGMMGGGMGYGGMGRGGMGMMRTDPSITPILYAQNAPYLLTQLNDFASGRRHGSVMGPIAARLTPPERAALAAYLARHAPASR